MKKTRHKAKNGIFFYQRLIEMCRKTLQLSLIVLSVSTPGLSSEVDGILAAVRQNSTADRFSAVIKTTVKTPFGEDQITEGQITVSGNLSLIDFSMDQGPIFLKTATADWKISADGMIEEISAEQTPAAGDFDQKLLTDSYRFELISNSDKRVVLQGHSDKRNAGTFQMQISLPDHLLRQVEVFGEDGRSLALVEIQYFEDSRIVGRQKTIVSAADFVLTNITEYSGLVVEPVIGSDFFEPERAVRYIKEAGDEYND
jgi:hypothetical protein